MHEEYSSVLATPEADKTSYVGRYKTQKLADL